MGCETFGSRKSGWNESPGILAAACVPLTLRSLPAKFLVEALQAGDEGMWLLPYRECVQDWNDVAGKLAADCRIWFQPSSFPIPVFAEKGITGAVGYASCRLFNEFRS